MTALYHLNENTAHLLEGFLESAVPLIAGLAEVIGLFIIVTSLVKATYHYVRTTFFHDRYDFHHEMSTGLTTALEFLMSAEIAKTFLLQNLESVIPLAATFALRALMSLLLHVEMRADHTGKNDACQSFLCPFFSGLCRTSKIWIFASARPATGSSASA